MSEQPDALTRIAVALESIGWSLKSIADDVSAMEIHLNYMADQLDPKGDVHGMLTTIADARAKKMNCHDWANYLQTKRALAARTLRP